MSSAPPPSDPSGDGLAQRTIDAGQWRLASSGVRVVLQFGVGVLLARLLPPADFGLAALAFIVISFAETIVDLGLGPAIVQREDLTERHVRVSFTLSMLVGCAFAAALALGAPLFGVLLRNEALPEILRWEAILFVFAGIAATGRAVIERKLDFRGVFLVDFSSYLLGYAVVAVTMALMGFGVWSLVCGSILQAAVAAGVTLVLARHPMRPLVAWEEFRELSHFGVGVILNTVVTHGAYNGDNLVVGRWLGSHALGLYSRAFQLMQLPLSQVGDITWNVLFSAYSRLQSDPARATRAYLKGIQMNALVVAPIMAGMVVAGPHLVVGLFGPQWAGSALPLQILCAIGLLRSVYGATGALAHALGAVYAEFRRQAMYAVLLIAAALAGTRWGIAGVAAGVAVSVVFMYLAMAQLGVRLTGCRWVQFFRAQLPGVVLGGIVASVALAVRFALEARGASSGIILLAVIVACAAALPVGLYLLPAAVRPIDLFRTLSPSVARLPASVQPFFRLVMRLPPGGAAAPS